MAFEKLFEPVKIGKMELKNRIVMAPMANRLNDEFGAVTQRFIDFYVERAKGGAGLIIVENTCVDWPQGKAGDFPARLDDDKFIYGFHDLAEAVHPYGAKLATQLQHAGGNTSITSTEGLPPIAPSMYGVYRGSVPREISLSEIQEVIEKFGEAARRTKAAGFDAVEIHGAHGYLITQFLSPLTNQRNDLYGGSLENRLRFPLEVVARCREKVGPDFPIIFRFSADEHVLGGVDVEEAKIIARRLEEAGVDALDVSAGIQPSRYWIFPIMAMPRGCNVPLGDAIKKVVDSPVAIVGRINDPLLAEKILQEGKADLIAMGRPLVADPYLPKKAAEGRLEDIRPCIACNACTLRLMRHWRLGCTVNTEVGKEGLNRLVPAEKPKRVMVVGGGPAGMEAARVAALRGHEVTLYERGSQLGGQLLLASVPPFKKEIEGFVRYLTHQLEKLEVNVVLNNEVTSQLVEQAQPETVILATGARPLTPDLPGIESENVVTAESVLAGEAEVDKQVVIVGGGRLGVELAYYLAEQGLAVTLVEMEAEIGRDMELSEKMYFSERLNEHRASILTNTKLQAVTPEGIEVINRRWETNHIPATTVVLAMGACPQDDLLAELRETGIEVHAIGDCVQPRTIYEAVHEGAWVARQI
jgi:2,4-dienoyl-CoA reductase-like NADH-dependent reductase (Old Yellow Enzyme family)/thioredoxin reductase